MSWNDFEIKPVDSEKGQGLFAKRAYAEGDVIFEEKPVISCQYSWNADYGYLACDHCMRPLETAEENVRRLADDPTILLPYPECCETVKELIAECPDCGNKYCCIGCLEEAYLKYHKTLCLRSREKLESHPLVQLNEMWKQMQYPPETSTIMLIARMVAAVNQASNKEEIMSSFAQFCHNIVNETSGIPHNLLEEKFQSRIDTVREMAQSVLNTEYTSHWFTPEGFRSLLALIGTNGQGIASSAIGRWAKNVEALELPKLERIKVDKLIKKCYDKMLEVVGSFLNNEGSGLYTLQSKMNHSCIPNAVVEFPNYNNVLMVKALKNILPGEEICTSYLDECDLESSRHSRQKILSSYYLFLCQCERCVEQMNDPDVTSEEDDDDDEDEDDDDDEEEEEEKEEDMDDMC